MNTDLWNRAKELFHEAADLSADARDAFVAERCGDDERLARELESLLLADAGAGGFLDGADRHGDGEAGPPLTRAGPYRILREIGHGGMGTVYLAVRDDGFQKRVALKVVRKGMDTEEIQRRFRNERQILAGLEHPNIARLLDGGKTPEGISYLVMEYVEGERIDEYCDRHRLSTRQRLELFRTVCSAVHSAHQNLVVHRDIKPGNILVTEDGTPKLLDFGIAKLLNPELGHATIAATVLRPLTPEYSSPEQVRGERVTTASDVYSLGVLLYQMLTGHRPYQVKRRTSAEIERIICEEDPPRPSTAVSRVETVGGRGEDDETITPGRVSELRATQPGRLKRRLSGDLDNIVLMALRKEPRRRYASAEQFAADIGRHIDGLPVIAHQESFLYRGQKFLGRNWIAASAALLVAVSLVSGATLAYWQARVAQDQARIAAIERAKAERISEFLREMLASPDASWNAGAGVGGRDLTVLQVLESASRRLSEDPDIEPEVRASLHRTVGNSYRALALFDEAEPELLAALALDRSVIGNAHWETAQSLHDLGALRLFQGDYTAAEPLLIEAMNVGKLTLEDPALVGEARARREWLVAAMTNDAGLTYWFIGQPDEAEPLMREGLEGLLAAGAPARAPAAVVLNNLGLLRLDHGDLDGSAEYFQRSIDRFEQLPRELPEKALALGNLGFLRGLQGRYDEADRLMRRSLDLVGRTRGLEHPTAALVLVNIATNELARDDISATQDALAAAKRIQDTSLTPTHSNVTRRWIVEGRLATRLGQTAVADALLRDALEARERSTAPGHWRIAEVKGALGANLLAQSRNAEAESMLRDALAISEQALGNDHPLTRRIADDLATLR